MSDEKPPLPPEVPKDAKVIGTKESLELTDKIHRLVRRFSRELAELVSAEIGARAVKVQKKRGPPKGFKMPRSPCPICKGNPNTGRCYGFICKDCRAGRPIGHRQKVREVWKGHEYKKKDPLGKDFKVEVKVPKHIPVKPKPVEIDDEEAAFLDSIVQIVKVSKPAVEQPPKTSESPSSDDGMDFFT
jgi:hypothetical protein